METAQKNFLKSDVGNSKVSSQYKLFYLNLNLAKYILGSFLTNVLVRRLVASLFWKALSSNDRSQSLLKSESRYTIPSQV